LTPGRGPATRTTRAGRRGATLMVRLPSPFERAMVMKSSCNVLMRSDRQQSVVDGDRPSGDGQRRQDHVVQVGCRVLGERDIPGGREPVQPHGEDGHHDRGDDEGWEGQQSEGAGGRHIVQGPVGSPGRHQGQGMATAKAMTCEMTISSTSMGNPVATMCGDRFVVEVRLAQVAVEHRTQPDEVLLVERLLRPSCSNSTARLWAVSLGPRMITDGVRRAGGGPA